MAVVGYLSSARNFRQIFRTSCQTIYREPTSSSNEGRIFLVRNPSENLSKTLVNPFMKEIFSSRVFEVKLERSKKLSVDMGRDEKKE